MITLIVISTPQQISLWPSFDSEGLLQRNGSTVQEHTASCILKRKLGKPRVSHVETPQKGIQQFRRGDKYCLYNV